MLDDKLSSRCIKLIFMNKEMHDLWCGLIIMSDWRKA